MQDRRCSAIIGIAACLMAIWASGLSGCATAGSSAGPEVGGGSIRSGTTISFEIRAMGGGATIYIDDEERGDTPVLIRAETDATGGTARDMVIKAVFAGSGGNELEFTIPRGSRPQAIVRVGPNGEREY